MDEFKQTFEEFLIKTAELKGFDYSASQKNVFHFLNGEYEEFDFYLDQIDPNKYEIIIAKSLLLGYDRKILENIKEIIDEYTEELEKGRIIVEVAEDYLEIGLYQTVSKEFDTSEKLIIITEMWELDEWKYHIEDIFPNLLSNFNDPETIN